MKILQVGKFYRPAMGGIESVLRNLSEGLVGRGHSVTVLCTAERPRTFARTEEVLDGVRVVRLPHVSTVLSQPLSPQLPIALRSLARQHDLVHLHSPNPMAEASLLALGIRADVVTYHSDVVRQRALVPVYRPIILRLLMRAGVVVAATERLKQSSACLRQVAHQTRVIPFGLPAASFELSPATRKRAAELSERYGKYVVFVGRLVGYKGLEHLIQAMDELEQVSLIVIGEGPLRDSLESRARSGPAAGRILFKGRVESDAELAAHLYASQALVLPSVSENEAFGVVLLEAMACGRPTIATRLNTGVSEVIVDGQTGVLVEPGDPKALTEAILRITSDSQWSATLGANGQTRFRDHFSIDSMLDGYEAVYSELFSALKPSTRS